MHGDVSAASYVSSVMQITRGPGGVGCGRVCLAEPSEREKQKMEWDTPADLQNTSEKRAEGFQVRENHFWTGSFCHTHITWEGWRKALY